MENQMQPSGSNFGPRSRMSARSKKVANRSMRGSYSRFSSTRMKGIAKEMKKREAYMPPMRNRNDRSGIDVTNNARMHSGKKTYVSDKKDQDGNIISTQAKKVPPKDSRGGQSLDVVLVNRTSIPLLKGANKSKQSLSHISENVSQSPTSRLDNSLIPLMDNIMSSNPSGVKNVSPLKNLENPTLLLSKDGSNDKLRCQKQSYFRKKGVVQIETPEAILPLENTSDSKVVTKSAHNEKNANASTNDGDTLVSMSNGPLGHTQGQNIDVRNDTNEITKPLKCTRVSKGSSIPLASEHLVPNKYDPNEYVARQEVMNAKEIEPNAHICEVHAIYEDNHEQEEITKVNGAPNSSSLLNFEKLAKEPARNMEKISSTSFGKDLSRHQGYKTSCIEDKNCAIASSKDVVQSEFIETCLELHKKDQPVVCAGKINDINSKREMEPLLEEKIEACDDDDSTRVVQWDNLTHITKKRRRYLPPNEEDEDEVGGDNKNMIGSDGTIGSTPLERQCDYCSKPIDEPTWSGIFKIDGKELISLAAHLSTKSCEKVWKLSKSLPPVVKVERVPRLVAWPRIWKESKPSGDNIGLYFLPHNMRHDEELDQLVNEVKEHDLILRAVTNEAEMLIFPSVLLLNRYQVFQAKHYLWAVFKPREDKGVYLQNH